MTTYSPVECDIKSKAVILVAEGLQRCPKRHTKPNCMYFFRNEVHVQMVNKCFDLCGLF